MTSVSHSSFQSSIVLELFVNFCVFLAEAADGGELRKQTSLISVIVANNLHKNNKFSVARSAEEKTLDTGARNPYLSNNNKTDVYF